MKRQIITAAILLAGATFGAISAKAEGDRSVTIDQENFAKLAPADQRRVLEITERLEAMTAMDRSELDRAARKEVRQEFRALRSEVKEINRRAGGTVVYISTAGLIIIILLLILIL
ncbi:MAG: hypothetical protein R2815_05690 [Flavobacteriales bacterium]